MTLPLLDHGDHHTGCKTLPKSLLPKEKALVRASPQRYDFLREIGIINDYTVSGKSISGCKSRRGRVFRMSFLVMAASRSVREWRFIHRATVGCRYGEQTTAVPRSIQVGPALPIPAKARATPRNPAGRLPVECKHMKRAFCLALSMLSGSSAPAAAMGLVTLLTPSGLVSSW